MPEQPTSAITNQPPKLPPLKGWQKAARIIDVGRVLKPLYEGRTFEDENKANLELQKVWQADQYTRERDAEIFKQALQLKKVEATNQLEQIRATGSAQTDAKRIEEERLRKVIRDSTRDLAIMQGKTPEEATRLGDEQVLKMTVVPAQLNVATIQNALDEAVGGAPDSKKLGQFKVTSAIADLQNKQEAANLGAITNQAQQAGAANLTVDAQAAQDMKFRADRAAETDRLLISSAVPSGDVIDLEQKRHQADLERMKFFKENPVAQPGVNLPRGSGFDNSQIKSLVDLKTLNSEGGASTNNYGATSALGLLPGFQTVKPKFRPIPGIKLDMQPTTP